MAVAALDGVLKTGTASMRPGTLEFRASFVMRPLYQEGSGFQFMIFYFGL